MHPATFSSASLYSIHFRLLKHCPVCIFHSFKSACNVFVEVANASGAHSKWSASGKTRSLTHDLKHCFMQQT